MPLEVPERHDEAVQFLTQFVEAFRAATR